MKQLWCWLICTFLITTPALAQDSQDEVRVERISTLGRGIIRDVAWSLDGETVAAISSTGVWLYDPDFPEAPHLLAGDVRGGERLVFTSDGNALVVAENDGDVWRWNVGDFSEMPSLYSMGIGFQRVALGSDGQTLAAVSYSQGRDHLIRLIKLESDGMTVRTLRGHTDRVLDVAFSSDNTRVASIGMDGTLIVWDTTKGVERFSVQIFEPPLRPSSTASRMDIARATVQSFEVRRVAFSPDGRWLLVNSWPTGHVLDAETGEIINKNAFGAGDSLTFSPDGERLFSVWSNYVAGGSWNSFNQFSSQNGEVDRISGLPREYYYTLNDEIRASFSPDHSSLAIAGVGDVQFTDEAEIENWMPYNTSSNRIALNTDGSQLVAMGADNRVRLIDVESGEAQLLPLEDICDAAFTQNDTELVLIARDGTLFHWNLATWTLDAKLPTVIERVCSGFRGFYGVVFTRDTDFTNDGALLAAHAQDREIYLIDTTTGETLATLERSEDGRYDSLKFSQDGAWLATGGTGIYAGQQPVLLWDVNLALETGRLASDDAMDWVGILATTYSYAVHDADDGVILSEDISQSCDSCYYAHIVRWERNGEGAMTPTVLRGVSFGDEVEYSPDGRLFVVGSFPPAPTGGSLWVYDAQSNEEIFNASFNGHPSSIQFSGDGSRLAVATEDGLIHIYQINYAAS